MLNYALKHVYKTDGHKWFTSLKLYHKHINHP